MTNLTGSKNPILDQNTHLIWKAIGELEKSSTTFSSICETDDIYYLWSSGKFLAVWRKGEIRKEFPISISPHEVKIAFQKLTELGYLIGKPGAPSDWHLTSLGLQALKLNEPLKLVPPKEETQSAMTNINNDLAILKDAIIKLYGEEAEKALNAQPNPSLEQVQSIESGLQSAFYLEIGNVSAKMKAARLKQAGISEEEIEQLNKGVDQIRYGSTGTEEFLNASRNVAFDPTRYLPFLKQSHQAYEAGVLDGLKQIREVMDGLNGNVVKTENQATVKALRKIADAGVERRDLVELKKSIEALDRILVEKCPADLNTQPLPVNQEVVAADKNMLDGLRNAVFEMEQALEGKTQEEPRDFTLLHKVLSKANNKTTFAQAIQEVVQEETEENKVASNPLWVLVAGVLGAGMAYASSSSPKTMTSAAETITQK